MITTLVRYGRDFSPSALLLVARLAGAGFGILTQIILARSMPAASLGLFFFATSLAAVLSVVTATGYPQVTTRFLSRYRTLNRRTRCAAFYRHGQRDILIVSLGLAALVIVLTSQVSDPETVIVVGIAAASAPVLALGQFVGAVANVERRFLLASLPELLIRPFALAVAVGAGAWLGFTFSPAILLVILLLVSASAVFAQMIALRGSDMLSARILNISRPEKRLWRKAAAPLVIVAMFTMLFADVAILITSPFMTRGELAVMAICVKISFLIGFGLQAIQQTTMPGLAEDLRCGQTSRAMGRLNDANGVSVGVTLIAFALVWVSGDRLLMVFNTGFASAHHVLTILMAAQVVRALFGPAAQMLTVLGLQRIVIAVCPIALVVLGVANAILIPLYGLFGAAVAIVIAITFWAGSLSVALARATGLRSSLNIRFTHGAVQRYRKSMRSSQRV